LFRKLLYGEDRNKFFNTGNIDKNSEQRSKSKTAAVIAETNKINEPALLRKYLYGDN
jgi:hypothetical protein